MENDFQGNVVTEYPLGCAVCGGIGSGVVTEDHAGTVREYFTCDNCDTAEMVSALQPLRDTFDLLESSRQRFNAEVVI